MRGLVHINAVERDRPLLRPPLAADDAQQRGLAGAGRTHDRRDFAARDIDIDPFVNLARAMAEMQAAHAHQHVGVLRNEGHVGGRGRRE